MVSVAYVAAVAAYFLILYPYIVVFVSWAVWAIEGLPPPSYEALFMQGRLLPLSSTDVKTRLRDEVRRRAKQRSGEEKQTDKKSSGAVKNRKNKSPLATDCNNRRTRLDEILGEAADLEKGQSSHVEFPDGQDGQADGKQGGDKDTAVPHRSFSTEPCTFTGFPHNVSVLVFCRVVFGYFLFHAVFIAFPFWFRSMNYSWASQTVLPLNTHDQD